MRNPFFIEGPAIINVSGGRSSGLMLKLILDAHGGKLPDDVVPVFANTGEEAEGTLNFIREMAEYWNVNIRWVEFIRELPRWREVTFCTASREGEPFDAMVDWKKYVPNATQKICTEWLKVRTVHSFAKSIGFTERDHVLGIRADEPERVAKHRDKSDVLLPLADAKITRAIVGNFWAAQPFDLHIRNGEGNCRLCFLKGRSQLQNVIRDAPDEAGVERWIDRERRIGATMRKRDNYSTVAARARRQLPMFTVVHEDDFDMRPCSCGD